MVSRPGESAAAAGAWATVPTLSSSVPEPRSVSGCLLHLAGVEAELDGGADEVGGLAEDEAVDDLAAAALGIDDAGALEHAEVLGNQGLGLAETVDEFMHEMFSDGQTPDDLDAQA